MWMHTWSCLLLVALSVYGEQIQDHNEVSLDLYKTHLVDVSKNVTVSRNSTSNIEDQTSEAPSKLNIDPKTLFRFFRVAKASGDWSKNLRVRKWLQYVAKLRRNRKHDHFTDKILYDLLKQSKTKEEIHALFQELKHEKHMQSLADKMLTHMELGSLNHEMETMQPNVQETAKKVIDWQNVEPYTESFLKKLEKAIPSDETLIDVAKGDVIATQKALYPIYDSLKQMNFKEDLVDIFEWVEKQPEVAKIGNELKKIAAQDNLLNKIQKLKKPYTPREFILYVHVKVAGPNPKFILWLRYFQSYPSVAKDNNGKSIIILDESLWQMVIDILKPTVPDDQMASLFELFREVPGLEKFADKMVGAATRAHSNQKWLAKDLSAGDVFMMIDDEKASTGISPMTQWLRYINLLEAKKNCVIKLEDITNEDAEHIFDVEVKDSSRLNLYHGASFEPVKDVYDVKSIAERLQSELFDVWIKLNKTPKNLFDADHSVHMNDFNTVDFRRLRESFAAYYAKWLMRGKKE
ncbi:hypothetical protein Plhal703r1_c35g0130311 [Plasmopara halstedii]